MRKSGISLRVRVIRDEEFNDIVRLAGSSPATSIKFKMWEMLNLSAFPVFFSTKFL